MTEKCLYCGKEFETHNSLQGHKGHCKKYNEAMRIIFETYSLEDYNNMINEGYSMLEISKLLKEKTNIKVDVSSLIKYLNKNNIKTPNMKQSANSPRRLEKFKQTVLERYGVDNVSKSPIIQKKKEETFLKHYGMKNIFYDKEFIQNKVIEKYGKYVSTWEIQKINNKLCKACISFGNILEEKVMMILNDLNIKYINNPVIDLKKYNEYLKKEYNPRPDFLLENNKIIEVYGDYWHGNPIKYKATDINKHLKITVEKIWEKNKNRIDHIESFGYKVLILWEYDIYNNYEKVVQDIKNFL